MKKPFGTRALKAPLCKGSWHASSVTEGLSLHWLLYKRSIDTIRDLADSKGLGIAIMDGFKERRVDSVWIEDYNSFCKKQWEDFSYKLSDGECLAEVQNRNISALSFV